MRTAFVIRAIIPINDDGILDIVHDDIPESNVPCIPIAWSSPWFDSPPIVSVGETRTCYRNILDTFVKIITKIPNTAWRRGSYIINNHFNKNFAI